jgi:hypothetical protein
MIILEMLLDASCYCSSELDGDRIANMFSDRFDGKDIATLAEFVRSWEGLK